MSEIVLDASALLALIRGERGAEAVVPHLGEAAVSAVNLAETYGRLLREAFRPEELRRDLDALGLDVRAFDGEQALVAGRIEPQTRRFGLSLGDRACLALASVLGRPALTADRDWTKVDLGIDIRLIR